MTERVSDPVDRATQLEEAEREAAARVRRPVVKRTGKCVSCGEPLADPAGYACDAECREEAERRERAAQRNGRA